MARVPEFPQRAAQKHARLADAELAELDVRESPKSSAEREAAAGAVRKEFDRDAVPEARDVPRWFPCEAADATARSDPMPAAGAPEQRVFRAPVLRPQDGSIRSLTRAPSMVRAYVRERSWRPAQAVRAPLVRLRARVLPRVPAPAQPPLSPTGCFGFERRLLLERASAPIPPLAHQSNWSASFSR